MLVQLGKRNEVIDAVDLLIECHGRIRKFLSFAKQLAQARDASVDVVRDTAGQSRRYFAEAVPLHIVDEDELIDPRLRGRSAVIDEALAKMQLEHVQHAPLVDRLIEVCECLLREPHRLEELAIELRDAAIVLQAALDPHLAREETVLFPALRQLSASERDAIKAGMRERREARS